MAFIRCDQGGVPSDHDTLAMLLQPHSGYVHSAYQLTDLDEVAAAGGTCANAVTGTLGHRRALEEARSSTTGATPIG